MHTTKRSLHVTKSIQLDSGIPDDSLLDTIEKLMGNHQMKLAFRDQCSIRFIQTGLTKGIGLGNTLQNLTLSIQQTENSKVLVAKSTSWEIMVLSIILVTMVYLNSGRFQEAIILLVVIPSVLIGIKHYTLSLLFARISRRLR